MKIKNNSAPNCIQIVGPKESMIKHASILGGRGGWANEIASLIAISKSTQILDLKNQEVANCLVANFRVIVRHFSRC